MTRLSLLLGFSLLLWVGFRLAAPWWVGYSVSSSSTGVSSKSMTVEELTADVPEEDSFLSPQAGAEPQELVQPSNLESRRMVDLFHLPTNAVVHSETDFERGQSDNVEWIQRLRLGERIGNADTQRGYSLFGTFCSAEQVAPHSFNRLLIDCNGTFPEESAVVIDARVQFENGAWSEWQEIKVADKADPISWPSPAVGWQYRLAFYAIEHSSSPEIEAVVIIPTME